MQVYTQLVVPAVSTNREASRSPNDVVASLHGLLKYDASRHHRQAVPQQGPVPPGVGGLEFTRSPPPPQPNTPPQKHHAGDVYPPQPPPLPPPAAPPPTAGAWWSLDLKGAVEGGVWVDPMGLSETLVQVRPGPSCLHCPFSQCTTPGANKLPLELMDARHRALGAAQDSVVCAHHSRRKIL